MLHTYIISVYTFCELYNKPLLRYAYDRCLNRREDDVDAADWIAHMLSLTQPADHGPAFGSRPMGLPEPPVDPREEEVACKAAPRARNARTAAAGVGVDEGAGQRVAALARYEEEDPAAQVEQAGASFGCPSWLGSASPQLQPVVLKDASTGGTPALTAPLQVVGGGAPALTAPLQVVGGGGKARGRVRGGIGGRQRGGGGEGQ